ncbi:hemerythrin domain-containing protein [Streptomyces albireticuli]|uniref:Hemerythrin n=1 Tax=Streptomyces albireticuli TaxID=1940 RepID=A0A2A2DC82_9ACTN|nr:hemerythrin domain-containing protein [Streptomyces albireticuli]MCD9194609.1 hemerythrin domain-containing protein [Streptomyces albireticuli]PAU48960.1 hemerythrin [Streptomyces albireticuli]
MTRTDIITELETDHRVIEALFTWIHRTPIEDTGRERLLQEAAGELARHTAAQERYLYPAVRSCLPGGDGFVEKENAGQERLTAMLRGLESCTVLEPGFDGRVRALEREVTQHIRHEEHDLFPTLRQGCPPETLQRLGAQVREDRARDRAVAGGSAATVRSVLAGGGAV